MRRTHRLFPLLMVTAIASGCSSGSDVDCGKIADHKMKLAIAAVPEQLRERAKPGIESKRDTMLEACEKRDPGPAVASCQLEATDLRAFQRCADR